MSLSTASTVEVAVTVGLTFPLGNHAPARRRPRRVDASADAESPRRRAAVEHAPWCVQHSPAGCQGQIFSLPGTQLLVWLSAPTSDDPRLVVEGPDGLAQLPVQA